MQIVIEVPHGPEATHALKVLGGFPEAGRETWVAIARLDPKAAQEVPGEPDKPKFSLTQQAGIACNDQRFVAWLHDIKKIPKLTKASEAVHRLCNVASRAEFDKDQAAGERWKALWAEYKMEDKI